jgi:hypothetical protein
MNRKNTRAGVPALLALLLVLSGCPTSSGDPETEAPELRGAVSVGGSASVGGTVTADTSLLEGTGNISYQWIQDGETVIDGAVAESYGPVAADAGKTLKVRVSRAGYRGTVESDPVGPVEAATARKSFNYTLKSPVIKFFSLAQGTEIDASKSNTTEWDFAIESREGSCYIYTNSGESAAYFGAAGDGRVWFTNETNFNSVTLADRVTEYTGDNAQYADCAAYETDVTRYQSGMYGPVGGRMNIMTYYGYLSGGGLTEDDPFGWSIPGPPSSPFYEFNKRAFAFAQGGMPPPWYPTSQVYIIRHADGASYSKFQVHAVRYRTSYTFILSFKFENL